ncbi:hypothetical protein ACOMHN_002879 [Nucella lapillus]
MSGRMILRRMSTVLTKGQPAGIVPNTPRYKKIQELQNLFSRDDGLMVWQKLGRDKMMYYTTIGLMVCGFVPSLGTIWKMSFPKPES